MSRTGPEKEGANMTINEILAIIQGNKWYYIAALTIIPTVVTVIGNVIIDKIRGDKGKCKKAMVSTVLYILTTFIGVALPILFPLNDEVDLPIISLNEYRFDMYDDQQIVSLVSEVNADLGHDGKRVEPDAFKAFIYAMNGDYSLYSDPNDFLDTAVLLYNVDVDAVNILRSNYLTDDQVSPLNSIANVFRDEYDYETVLYWQNRYNEVYAAIYENACSEDVIQKVDETAVAIHRFLISKETVSLPSGKNVSIDSISDEAEFLISFVFANKMAMLVISPDGGNREAMIPFGTVAGADAYIDIRVLSEELMNAANNHATSFCERINQRKE